MLLFCWQTGSGKTYTIRGVPEEYSTKGIIPRTIQYVFDCIQNVSLFFYNTILSSLKSSINIECFLISVGLSHQTDNNIYS